MQVEKALRTQGPRHGYECHLLCTLKSFSSIQVLWKDTITLHSCVFMHVFVCVSCVCSWTCVIICVFMHVFMFYWLCIVFVNVCLCADACLCVCMCEHMCACVFVHEVCIMGIFICLSHLSIHKLSVTLQWPLLLCINLVSRKVPSSSHTCQCMMTGECMCYY